MTTIKVAVGSTNPVKISAVENAFRRVIAHDIDVVGYDTTTSISDQPQGDLEGLVGAIERTEDLDKQAPNACFHVGIESIINRVLWDLSSLETYAWIVIANSQYGFATSRSASVLLPDKVCKLVINGAELGPANDQVYKNVNTKQKMGAVGLYTRGVLTREDVYKQAVILALSYYNLPQSYYRNIK